MFKLSNIVRKKIVTQYFSLNLIQKHTVCSKFKPPNFFIQSNRLSQYVIFLAVRCCQSTMNDWSFAVMTMEPLKSNRDGSHLIILQLTLIYNLRIILDELHFSNDRFVVLKLIIPHNRTLILVIRFNSL